MYKIIAFIVISLISSFIPINMKVSDYFMTAIFTVMGIMFSIGMGLIVTFNLSSVKNKHILGVLRNKIKSLQESFITLFSFSTSIYIIEYFFRDQKTNLNTFTFNIKENLIIMNLSIFSLVFILLTIVYFIINFTKLQKLNNDILDETN